MLALQKAKLPLRLRISCTILRKGAILPPMSLLTVDNLHIDLGNRPLVEGVSLTLKAGETLCLVGESGSGKTLTALAIMGLLPEEMTPCATHLEFNGENLQNLSAEARRKLRGAQMGMVFQEPMTSLNPVIKVGEQVAEVFRIHTRLSKKQIFKEVIDLFNKVKIDDPVRRYHSFPHQLSGGQRQRVIIAMALALKPKLLIADEPTTALDATVQNEVLELIKSLQKEMGMGVLFVTHDFGVVHKIANRVVVMQNGKVVETGTVKQVSQKPKANYTKKLLAAMPKMDLRKKPSKSVKNGTPVLHAEAVSKSFPVKTGAFWKKKTQFKALDNVSVTLQKGEIIGVVGESGSGKSTLARCLLQLHKMDSGRVDILGQPIENAGRKELRAARRQAQMVFQDPFSSLNPRMKVGDAILEGVRAHKLVPAQGQRAYVAKLLKECGLPEDSYDRYPHQFSGGQRQRICIARALALEPALIIADEATSALDVSVQKQVIELLEKLKKQRGLSYLFISHDLRVVSMLADKVLVMRHGQVVEEGPAHEVFKNPKQPYTKQLLAAMP